MLLDRLIIWEYVQRDEIEVASKMGTLRDLDRTIYNDIQGSRTRSEFKVNDEIVPN